MLYTKGDTIEFQGGRLALVLDKGIKGWEFVDRYRGLMMNIVDCGPLVSHMRITGAFAYWTDMFMREEHIWYPVLIGDKKGWSTKRALREIELEGFVGIE